ncbi:MAG TPA: hypothetical protein VGN29_09850 [Solirubrobacteraceae bacterium]|jgi:hypothetical protein|nr:hypothetical protein [Solirubrobacteraceae bacterium]
MSDPALPLRTLAFGDLEGAAWGIAWFPDPGLPGFVALGSAQDAVTVEAHLDPDDETGGWRLHGYGVECNVSAAGEDPVELRGEFDAVCRVHGGITVEAVEHDVDCLGRLAAHAGTGDLDKFESVRDVSAWFDPVHGLSVVSLRPRKARGQDADVVSAVVLEPEGLLAIEDPRLSTTYAGDGRPLRVGLELWLSGDDDEEQYPRRASGETVGVAATGGLGRFNVLAQFMRWDSRYGDGAGVYLLAQQA